jgi:hypothetical protein
VIGAGLQDLFGVDLSGAEQPQNSPEVDQPPVRGVLYSVVP